MPSHYKYECTECGHTERRYRNSTKCRKCGGDIVRLTTKERQSTTEPRHWSDETADAAVQAAMEARALMLATARALGLPDERVEDAPQEAERLRTQLAQAQALVEEQ